MKYGESFKYHREQLGISQLELSKQIGTSHQNIGRWESGEVLPNIDFCVKLADFYGVTLDELVGRDKSN
ncbi:MAG: helix-turn-helix domain-containing protein [Clostridia bacterium]|nr:helix-turn-helix domain-containing protein [Clostridia bacterium]